MKKRRKILNWILLGVFAIVAGMQLIRPEKNKQSAPSAGDITQVVPTTVEVQDILKKACYDCHSNQTNYPWYAEIMPVGWWINHHVEEGKGELNFSEAANYSPKKRDHKLEEISEVVRNGEMPPKNYTNMHKEARLSPAQIDLVSRWATDARAFFQSPQDNTGNTLEPEQTGEPEGQED